VQNKFDILNISSTENTENGKRRNLCYGHINGNSNCYGEDTEDDNGNRESRKRKCNIPSRGSLLPGAEVVGYLRVLAVASTVAVT
jgi:hypothetical protein